MAVCHLGQQIRASRQKDSLESRLHKVVVHVRPQLLVVVAAVRLSPLSSVHPCHPAQLRHYRVLVWAELTRIHRTTWLLLLRQRLLLGLWRWCHTGMVLTQMARVWWSGLGLRGDAMRWRLGLRLGGGLHAWGRAGVRRLRLRPWWGLRWPDLTAEWSCRTESSLSLEVRVWGLSHLLLWTHWTAMLRWRSPSKVLLLQEPLVDVLVKHALGRLCQWWSTTCSTNSTLWLLPRPRSTLSRLERRSSSTSTGPYVLSLKTTHWILLLLLHLHLMLKPLLDRCSHFWHGVRVALLLA